MRTRILAALGTLSLLACGGGDDGTNAERLKSMALTEAACTTDADCCVVIDGCLATAYVVAAENYNEAIELATKPRSACVRCISPAVEVHCEAGACVGIEIEDFASAAYQAHSGNHCGEAIGANTRALSAETREGPAPTGRIFGCGAE